MKNPLHYQLSEYDCGPTSMLNAISFLFEEEHYVLLTGIEGDRVLLFDPYYQTESPEPDDIVIVNDHPFSHNRIVPTGYFNSEGTGTYALGPSDNREAILIFNDTTKLTEEKTIEYFI